MDTAQANLREHFGISPNSCMGSAGSRHVVPSRFLNAEWKGYKMTDHHTLRAAHLKDGLYFGAQADALGAQGVLLELPC